jgi:outer membrane receptor protein involved in Fe transport
MTEFARICIFAPCLVLLFPASLQSQDNGNGTIRGQVVDQTSKHPLEQVNIILQRLPDSSLVAGKTSDRSGGFIFAGVPAGGYFVRWILIGYKSRSSPAILIDPGHKNANLGKISLVETAVSLDEVLVTREKALFNNSIDRKIYNVDQDIMSKAGSASELLQNVPSVEVDIDGNVSLRGSSNVLMLINGKNSPLLGRNRAEVLQQMPASTIERIEVITNPSAKYSPDGTSGIINIVLKKNTSPGMNGSVTANAGNQERYNANVRLNYSPGDFNLFGSYSIRQDSRNRITTDSRLLPDSTGGRGSYRQDLASNASPLSHMVTLGFDIEPDDANSAGVSRNYFYNSFTRTDLAGSVLRGDNGAPSQMFDRTRLDNEFQKDYGVNAFYQHRFTVDDHKIRFEFTLSGHPEQEDNRFTDFYLLPSAPSQFDNTLIKPLENRTQISLDYSDPLTDHSNLEAGYSGEINHGDYNFLVQNFDPAAGLYITDYGKTSRFVFDETIHALYATYEHSFGAFRLLGGLRTEQAHTRADLASTDSLLTRSYFNLYPTLHLLYRFNESAELQLNYSRRVHRPESDDMNPFPEYRDPRNISSGNPSLKPEYIHSVEFGCKLQNELFSFMPSLYYRYTTNRFTTVTQALDDSTLLTTRMNLSNDQSAGLEVIASAEMADVFSSHASVNVFYDQIDASNLGYGTQKSVVTWSGALTFSVHIAKGTMLQANGVFNSYRLTPQGEFQPSFVINMGGRQDLFGNRLSLTLTVADIFHTLKRELELTTPVMNQTVINKRDSGVIYIGLTYNFGTEMTKSKEDQLRYDNGL